MNIYHLLSLYSLETRYLSYTSSMRNTLSFIKLINLNKNEVLSIIFKGMENNSNYYGMNFFLLLEGIIGYIPFEINSNEKGDIDILFSKWLEWGKEQGFNK